MTDTLARLRERGFGSTIGFGERPAVLVVDLIRAFTDPGRAMGSDLDAQVDQARRLADAARSHGVPLLFTTVAYDDPDIADAGIWLLKVPSSAGLRSGTEAVELDSRLGRRPEEGLVVKKYASAFFGTDLVARLNARGVDTLLIAGCSTSGCVRATAVDALQNGFRPVVVAEAVGDRTPAAHEQSLFDLQAKYADVVSADEAIAYLESR